MDESTNFPNKEANVSRLRNAFYKIRKYFMEFFLIFLAVILSFFVENIRDDYKEHNQARELAKALIADLVTDSLEFHTVMQRSVGMLTDLDTLILFLGNPKITNSSGAQIYVLALTSIAPLRVHPHEANVRQIINSGYLHTFKSKNVIQLLVQWESYLNRIALRQESDYRYRDETEAASYRVLDQAIFGNLRKFERMGYSDKIDSIRNIRLRLFTEDKLPLNEYLGWCVKRRNGIEEYAQFFLPSSLSTVRELINELKREFDLE